MIARVSSAAESDSTSAREEGVDAGGVGRAGTDGGRGE